VAPIPCEIKNFDILAFISEILTEIERGETPDFKGIKGRKSFLILFLIKYLNASK
jgi:hypothetical protein